MVTTEIQDSIAIIRMEHGKVNAMDLELFTDLQRIFADVQKSPAKAVILTGSGKAFSAGVDLFRLLKSGTEYIDLFVKVLCDVFENLFFSNKPFVAAVNGHAIAGGCIVACACDYRIGVKEGLTIGVTELPVGVPFPAIAFEIMRFISPPQYLQQIIYGGRTYPAEEAVKHGLLDETVSNETLMERSIEVARQLASIPAETFAITKRRLRAPVKQRLTLLPDESEQVRNAWRSPETHNVIRAYLDRTIGKR